MILPLTKPFCKHGSSLQDTRGSMVGYGRVIRLHRGNVGFVHNARKRVIRPLNPRHSLTWARAYLMWTMRTFFDSAANTKTSLSKELQLRANMTFYGRLPESIGHKEAFTHPHSLSLLKAATMSQQLYCSLARMEQWLSRSIAFTHIGDCILNIHWASLICSEFIQHTLVIDHESHVEPDLARR